MSGGRSQCNRSEPYRAGKEHLGKRARDRVISQVMPPDGSPKTQVGTTKEGGPRKEEETTWDIVTSHRRIGAPSTRRVTQTPIDLHCKCITEHDIFKLQRLPTGENGADPQRNQRRTL